VAGVPEVAYGGQGGFGDVVLTPPQQTRVPGWAEPGEGGTAGSAVGRARLDLQAEQPSLRAYRSSGGNSPRWTGIIISVNALPSHDGRYLFITSGERFKFTVAQDLNQNLSKSALRPREAFPPTTPSLLAARSRHEVYGHRNVLGLAFDGAGRGLLKWDPGAATGSTVMSRAQLRLAERFEWNIT